MEEIRLTTGKKLLFSAATTLAVLACLEGLARTWAVEAKERPPVAFTGATIGDGKFPIRWSDDRFWELIPNGAIALDERINRDGLRGPDLTWEKPPGVRRVLCLGDSCTFGIAVLECDTFARRLEKWLCSDPSLPWQTINAGVPGYSAYQMLQTWHMWGPRLQPDVVILYAGVWNDYGPAVGAGDRVLAKRLAARRSGSALEALSPHALMGFLAGSSAAPSAPDDARVQQYRELWGSEQKRPDGPRLELDDFRSTLVEILRSAANAGAATVVIVPPAPKSTRDRFRDGDIYAAAVPEAARETGALLVDARGYFQQIEATEPVPLFADIVHPSFRGHGILARMVAETLQKSRVAGVPAADPKLLGELPVSLKRLQPKARHEVGDPLAEITADKVTNYNPEAILVECPSRVTFAPIGIPASASLWVDYRFYTREKLGADPTVRREGPARTVGPVRFTIRAAAEGEESVVLLDDSFDGPDTEVWTPHRHRDLSLHAFGGKRVSLVLETKGAALAVDWGAPLLLAFR
ncbi:MAG: SGNH/GDSL hydrolase family protein [Planctomycetes bacterium]|nr:SGNH/GDSL hydrolase family protein [Planctomycetota bacterium]